jgi:hypothetical protein
MKIRTTITATLNYLPNADNYPDKKIPNEAELIKEAESFAREYTE